MARFLPRLESVSREWVERGLLSEAQRAAVVALEQSRPDESGRRLQFTVALLGSALVLTGVALIISANWQQITDWTKIGGIAALLAAAWSGGWWLRVEPGRHPKTGEAVLMVGAVLFLLAIALVSQVFHLDARPANGLLVWLVGIAAVPWLTRSMAAQFVVLGGLLVWAAFELNTAGTPWSVRGGGSVVHTPAALAILGAAVVASGFGLHRAGWGAFGRVHEFWGLLFLNAVLFWLTFGRHFGLAGANWTVLAGLSVVLGLVLFWGLRGAPREIKVLSGAMVVALVGPALFLGGAASLREMAWLASLATAGGLLLLDYSLVRAGLALGRESWVNFGLAFMGLNVFARYWDLFGTMLQGGLFFVVTGVVLIGGGFYLERQRRRLAAQLRELRS
jgi:hypothetical protein